MEKRKLRKKRVLAIQSVCCLIFILAVVGMFALYQYRLNGNFRTILTEGLEEDTKAQKQRAELIVSNLQELFGVLQNTAANTGSAVYSSGQSLPLHDGMVQVDYLDAQQALALSSSEELSPSGKEHCAQVLAGNDAATQLGEPVLTQGETQFALLHPVVSNGSLVGVLRAQIDAALLTENTLESGSLFQRSYVVLTQPDGSVVYADTPYPNGGNILFAAQQGGIDADEVEEIQRIFEENDGATITFQGKGNSYYMSWETLSFHDWRIVKFARSPDVVLQTTMILRWTVLIGVALIVLTGIFCVVLLQVLLRQKRRLETQQRRYDALSQFNDTLLFEYNVLRNVMTFTPNAVERLDLDVKSLEGLPKEHYMQRLLHPDDRAGIEETFRPDNVAFGETYYLEARFRGRDGAYNWFGCQFKSIEEQGGVTSRVVGKLVDISDQRGREQSLRQAALVDALTGVYNRTAKTVIDELLKKEVTGLFFMMDLDDFKQVNDRYGHAAGDALLIGVAQILKEVFRPEDIIARVGGDEFVVFLSGSNDARVAAHKATEIQSRMERLYISGIGRFASASIGGAAAPQAGATYEALARAADQAMYRIKKQSKMGFAFCDET